MILHQVLAINNTLLFLLFSQNFRNNFCTHFISNFLSLRNFSNVSNRSSNTFLFFAIKIISFAYAKDHSFYSFLIKLYTSCFFFFLIPYLNLRCTGPNSEHLPYSFPYKTLRTGRSCLSLLLPWTYSTSKLLFILP